MIRHDCALAAALWLVPAVAAAGETAADPEQALFDLYYDFEVAGYCTLVDQAVGEGFRARARVLESQLGAGPRRLQQVRGRAWQAAHAEWQNRGLGGFRAWCRSEGLRAARRMATFAVTRGAPAR